MSYNTRIRGTYRRMSRARGTGIAAGQAKRPLSALRGGPAVARRGLL
jgi:hypothetical protein